jgi:hypothetical protein
MGIKIHLTRGEVPVILRKLKETGREMPVRSMR